MSLEDRGYRDMSEKLHNLRMLEDMEYSQGCKARRVPGGWIFTEKDSLGAQAVITSVFVPYHSKGRALTFQEAHEEVKNNAKEIK